MQSFQLNGIFEVHVGRLLGRFTSASLPNASEGVALREAKDCV